MPVLPRIISESLRQALRKPPKDIRLSDALVAVATGSNSSAVAAAVQLRQA